MSSPLRIGIIGGGGIAGAHVSAYKKIENLEIVAVADVVPGKAEAFIVEHGLLGTNGYDDYRRLLELDIDAVSVCTPNVAHAQVSIDAMRAGKQVLVEKPMSVTLAEAVEMVQVSKTTGRMLSIGFQPRYDPNMGIIRDLIQNGKLGEVYYVETGGGRRRGMPGGTFISKELAGAGAMADIGCYSLDLALNALGYPKPVTVSAYTSNHFGTNPLHHREASRFEVEDFGAALIRFDNGMVLNFRISWAMHMDTLGATMFLGTEGGLKVTPAGKGNWSGVWDGQVGSVTLFHDLLGMQTETPIPLIEHKIHLFDEKVKHFVRAVRDGLPAPIPGEQIIRNQAIIDGVLRSAALKREVEIDLPEL